MLVPSGPGSRGQREGQCREAEGVGRRDADDPIGDGRSRGTDGLTVSGKFRCFLTDINRSRRTQSGDNGQTARRAGAVCCARSDDDPFVKVNGLVMSLISPLQDESLFEASQKAWCNEEISNATGKREDLEADTAKCSSSLETSRSSVLDGEISALQSELGVLSDRQLQMDIMCAVERYILAKVKADLEQGISGLQKALGTLRHYSMNSIDRVQQRLVEQTTETSVIPFIEKIVEMLVQTREKTQQAANTHVQHVVNTVEVETPKIIREAVRGKKSVIREKINQVAEHIKNPQIPYTNKVVDLMKDVLVVMQQQMPVQKTAEPEQG